MLTWDVFIHVCVSHPYLPLDFGSDHSHLTPHKTSKLTIIQLLQSVPSPWSKLWPLPFLFPTALHVNLLHSSPQAGIEDPWKQALFLLPQTQGHLTKGVFIKHLPCKDHESHLHYSSWLPPSILAWVVSDTSGCCRYDPCVTHVRKLPGCPSQVLTEGQLPQPAPNFLSRRSQSVRGKPKPPEGNF